MRIFQSSNRDHAYPNHRKFFWLTASLAALATIWVPANRGATAQAADAPATQPSPVMALPVAPSPATHPSGNFEPEILAFQAADRAQPPAKGGILFVGSSSIRMWKTLAQDFPGKPVLNRGFGGSLIPDSTFYAPRIVLPYAPKLIVFYAGDNDVNAGHSPPQILADFQKFVQTVRPALPMTRIDFISIKPSPSRMAVIEQMRQANSLIKQYVQTQSPTMDFIDVFTPMLDEKGQPRPELYGPDRLHMTPAGYKIWTAVVGPYLSIP